jgi:drug/metabolite transporter (DMT)-like permease
VSNHILAYYLALASSLAFSSASLIYADLSRKISPVWMNTFKAVFAWGCFTLIVVAGGFWQPLTWEQIAALFFSGVLGLAIGDIFLLTAYARMGAARTLILYGFQPLFMAVNAHVFFHQDISWGIGFAVVFFLACLFVFSLEKFKQDGHWELFGLGAAMLGVILDNAGLVLSRWSFDSVPAMNAFQANSVRCTGALAFFAVFGLVNKIHLREGWRKLSPKGRKLACLSAFLGCFFSLFLYLTAIKIGHLASVAALSVAGPILASAMECLYYRKWPSSYLLVALVLFVLGFTTLMLV